MKGYLVIEGPDHVGKTTAAKRAAEIAGWEYQHFGPPEEGFDYLNGYLDWLNGTSRVFDRFHLGAIAYGDMCGLYRTNLGPALLKRLLQRIYAECYVVILTASPGWLARNGLGDKPELYEAGATFKAARAFQWLAANRHDEVWYSHTYWDVERSGYPDDRAIVEWLRQADDKYEHALRLRTHGAVDF